MFVCLDSLCGHHDYSKSLCGSLAEAGKSQQVSICLLTTPPTDYKAAIQSAYEVHNILPHMPPTETYGNKLRWMVSKLRYYHYRYAVVDRFIRRSSQRVDIAHFLQEPIPLFAAALYKKLRRNGIRVVVTIHDIMTNRRRNGQFMSLTQRISMAAWRNCDAICVHSDRLRKNLSEVLGGNHPPIHVTPMGTWQCPPVSPAGQHTDTLLFFGSIHPYKGLEILLQAMQYLPYKLIIAGLPESSAMAAYMPYIRTLISLLPEGQVELHDEFIREELVPGYFDRAGLVITPYTVFTSQSGVMHQALGYERPVVVSDIGAMGDSVRTLGVGEVVPPGDVRGLVDGIRRALAPDRHAAAVLASAQARSELTWERMAGDTIGVYRSLLSNPIG